MPFLVRIIALDLLLDSTNIVSRHSIIYYDTYSSIKDLFLNKQKKSDNLLYRDCLTIVKANDNIFSASRRSYWLSLMSCNASATWSFTLTLRYSFCKLPAGSIINVDRSIP